MIKYRLPSINDPLWTQYAYLGFSDSGYIGFRKFVEAKVSGAKVEGTTARGLTLYFEEEKDFTLFVLKWT